MGHSAAVWDFKIATENVKDWNIIDQIVSLHGGQVISWRNDRGEELLFNSSKAIGYRNAGTVELIVDTLSRDFYFVDMNTVFRFLKKLLTEDLPRLFVRTNKIVLDFQKGKAVGPVKNDFNSAEV
ncbi:hypothetical protein L6452_00984 [Arctium lappa]|uniref:Uncharacterized protein n=1 Tax=Arctium lappa TaxID=4217 RepID=A0ACB9FG92_ARCLA|nr:hypothetical protein L6452_00984 [Arctium lappa]